MRQKRSKAWDMRYHWIRDRVAQEQFEIFWDKGTNNYADYFTKHHPPIHHQTIRPTYILKSFTLKKFVMESIPRALARVCCCTSQLNRIVNAPMKGNPHNNQYKSPQNGL